MIKFVAITIKLIGLSMIVLSIIHAYGIYNFPSAGLNKISEFFIAFLIGIGLLVIPASTIESLLVKKAEKELNK